MAQLLYRDLDGKDVRIVNPSQVDLDEMFRVVAEKNKGAFAEAFAEAYWQSNPLLLRLLTRA